MFCERWRFTFDTEGDDSNYTRVIEFYGPSSTNIYNKVAWFVKKRAEMGWKLKSKRCVGKRSLQ